MKIEVKVPCGSFDKLIEAHNEAVLNSPAKWVLLLNHDVYLACNPRWYEILLAGVEKVEQQDLKAGFITCVSCDRTRGPQAANISSEYVKYTDISAHEDLAQQLYKKYSSEIIPIQSNRIASFFILINKRVFKKIQFRSVSGGGQIDNMDYDFTRRLHEAGYTNYVMPGLYVYHRHYRNLIKIKKKKK